MIIEKDEMLICFINSKEPPVSEKHIAYYVSESDAFNITLNEIYEAYYPHPEAPESVILPIILTRKIKTFRRVDYIASTVNLLESAQNAVNAMRKYDA